MFKDVEFALSKKNDYLLFIYDKQCKVLSSQLITIIESTVLKMLLMNKKTVS